jgi:hypothetical protein
MNHLLEFQGFTIYGYFIAEDLRNVFQYRIHAEDGKYKIYHTRLKDTDAIPAERTLQNLSDDLETRWNL